MFMIKTFLKSTAIAIAGIFTLQCTPQMNTDTASAKKNAASARHQLNKIVLEEMTRGHRRMITITPSEKIIEINGVSKDSKTSAAEWETLAKLVQNQELDKIDSYESPTTKRYHDGAMMANLKITANGNTYTSQGFDSGTPPAQFSDLYFAVADHFPLK